MGTKTNHRRLTQMALGLPVFVLLVSYAAIAIHTGNPWPWLEVVHESGGRTLLSTVLYFEHAPPIATKRLSVGGQGRVVYRYKQPFRDGSTRAKLQPRHQCEQIRFRYWPRLCDNSNFKNPSGKLRLVCLIYWPEDGPKSKPLAKNMFLWNDSPLTENQK